MTLPDSLPLLMLQSREVEIALDLSDTNGTSLPVIAHKRSDRLDYALNLREEQINALRLVCSAGAEKLRIY